MTTTETCHYRGYDIVPTRLWSSWCVGVYRTRADLPLMAQSTLSTFAPLMEEGQAKHRPRSFPSTIGTLSKGTSARIATLHARTFGFPCCSFRPLAASSHHVADGT